MRRSIVMFKHTEYIMGTHLYVPRLGVLRLPGGSLPRES